MPLNGQSSTALHILQNLSLLLLAALLAPLCTYIAILSYIISPFTTAAKNIKRHRKWRATPPTKFRPRTILVTGVGMSKGLFLARAFHQAGHRVIGADMEPHGVLVCGRFSVALNKFYRLSQPLAMKGNSNRYTDDLVKIIMKEKVDLWVSCSGVASAVDDAKAAEAVEQLTKCKAIQFGVMLTEILHEKHSFIGHTQNYGLNVPDTHLITSVEDVMKFFYLTFPGEDSVQKRYIMKSVGLDDTIRADMTLLPRRSSSQTHLYLAHLNPSSSRPFVLQQYISGSEYCTHSLIIKGKVLAFTACRSSDLLMHYKALPSSSLAWQAMLKFTTIYAEKAGPLMTGHFSVDFLLDEPIDSTEEDIMHRIYPIECNPRAHTAVVLFADVSDDLVEAYLSILPDHSSLATKPDITTPSTTIGYYWIGHDLVTLVLIPFWDFALGKIDLSAFLVSWIEFIDHLLFWKDGTFEVWDPLPAWWLYCGYWPGMFIVSLLTRKWWSRCNVSTTKMFRC